jgi:hypothetical protein
MKKLLLLINLVLIFFSTNAQVPINDEPCGAVNIPVTQDADGCTGLFTSITNATFTNLAIPFTCWTTAPNNLQQDVWYKFTAIAGVDKLYLMKFGFSFNNYVEIFTANVCNGSFVNVKPCFQIVSDGTSYPMDVIPGQVYYLRVTSIIPNQSNFNVSLCITTFKPSPNARVGINTKLPFSNLDIAGNVQVRDSIAVNNLSVNGNFKVGNSFPGLNKVLTSDATGLGTWQNLPSGADAWAASGINILNNNFGNVGIGTATPTSKLNVDGQITVDQKNFGGYGGLLLKGDAPGNNYPNIGFTVKNNSPFQTDVVAALIQGDLINNSEGLETIDLTFHNSSTGLSGLSEKMRIKNNGNVGIGVNNPQYKLHIGNNNAGLRIEGPANALSGGAALSIGGVGDIVIDKPGVVGGRFLIKENGNIGIGNNNPNTALTFAPTLGKKITLYPGATGDVGFAVAGNRLQIYADNPNADVAIGYDAAGVFNEKFTVKPNAAIAIQGNTGQVGQVITSNGTAAASYKGLSAIMNASGTNGCATLYQVVPNVTTEMTCANVTVNINNPQGAMLLISGAFSLNAAACTGVNCVPAGFFQVKVDGVFVNSILQSMKVDGENVTFSNLMYNVGQGVHVVSFASQIGFGSNTTFFQVRANYSSVVALPN